MRGDWRDCDRGNLGTAFWGVWGLGDLVGKVLQVECILWGIWWSCHAFYESTDLIAREVVERCILAFPSYQFKADADRICC